MHQLVARFEALAALDLGHPSIARLWTTGIVEARAYLVQELVAAESLDIVLRDHGPSPLGEVVRVATSLAAALDRAAAAGVVHGALHPRDVLVGPENVRLTGLGVALALERTGIATAVRRPYTAPERLAGAPWDRRADIFSLAAVMYEMISGKRVTATGRQAAGALAEAAGDAAGLGQVIARALADDAQARFESAGAFAEALASAVNCRPEGGALRRSRTSVPAQKPVRSAAQQRPPAAPASERMVVEAEPVEPVEPVEIELRLPLDEPEPMDVPMVMQTAAPRLVAKGLAPAEEVDLTITRPPAPQDELMNTDTRETERARSAVWPLALAVAVGLAVGFAGGYGVASRDDGGLASIDGSPIDFTEVPVAAAAVAPVLAAAARPAPEAAVAPPAVQPRVRPSPAAPKTEVRAAPRPAVPKARPAAVRPAPAARARPVPAPPKPAAGGMGGLLVDSRPVGANVFVDNKLIGTTPLVFHTLAPGDHAVRLEREGYQHWSSSVKVVSGQRNRVTASLEH